MRQPGRGLRLSIFVRESDLWHHKSLYVEIVHRAHEAGLAGATVVRGVEGFGSSRVIHRPHGLRLNQDMPVLIVIADEEDRIRSFASELDEMDIDGLITMDEVEVVRYPVVEPSRRHWWQFGTSGPS